MSRPARYAVGLLILALLTVALPLTRAMLSAYVVEPISVSLWAAWRVIDSVNQGVYWLLLIVLFGLLTIRVFSGRGSRTIEEERTTTSAPRGPIERWQALFENAGESEETDEVLRASLRRLAMELFTEPGQREPVDMMQALRSAPISLPPEAASYLLSDKGGGAARFVPLAWLMSRLPSKAGTGVGKHGARIDQVLEWLEATVEINHDES